MALEMELERKRTNMRVVGSQNGPYKSGVWFKTDST